MGFAVVFFLLLFFCENVIVETFWGRVGLMVFELWGIRHRPRQSKKLSRPMIIGVIIWLMLRV